MLKAFQTVTARRDAILRGERDGGFTLIELLIVVLIIGVLAAIAIPVYLSTVNTAKDESAKATVSQALNVIRIHHVQEGSYPADQAAFEGLGDWLAPGSEITVTYTGGASTFCVQANAGAGTFHADQADGAPVSGTC